jgi:gluconokinase
VHVVVMGVSGTGKSRVGELVAGARGLVVVEGDVLHPPENVRKMAAGTPLSDADRLPWLDRLAEVLARNDSAGVSTVMTCSALRRSYRDVLRSGVRAGEVFFLHLHADVQVLRRRMEQREGHFMPARLLDSQLEALEPLGDDEVGAAVDVSGTVEQVVDRALAVLRARYG